MAKKMTQLEFNFDDFAADVLQNQIQVKSSETDFNPASHYLDIFPKTEDALLRKNEVLPQYIFVPKDVGKDSDGMEIIDYTGIESNKIFLVDEKNITEKNIPSWMPPLSELSMKEHDYNPICIKEDENTYLILDNDKNMKYRLPLDVLSATIDYHIKVAREKEEQKVKIYNNSVISMFTYLGKYILNNNISGAGLIKVNDTGFNFSQFGQSFKIMMQYNSYSVDTILSFNKEIEKGKLAYPTKKPKRITRSNSKKRMLSYRYSAIENYFKSKGETLIPNKKVFEMYNEINDDITQKLLDMTYEKREFLNVYFQGEQTSYGNSLLNDTLVKEFGVMVKRQNGDIISPKAISEIKNALKEVYTVFGDISDIARKYNLKISHADGSRMHARKSVGIFYPSFNAIGVSHAGSGSDSLILAHEFSHFIDFYKGNKINYNHNSDKPGTIENSIASSLRSNMSLTKESDYYNRTCECFARAMEEYTALKLASAPAITQEEKEKLHSLCNQNGYVKYEVFNEKIMPLCDECISEIKQLIKQETLQQTLPQQNNVENFPKNISYLANTQGVTGLEAAQILIKNAHQKDKVLINAHLKKIGITNPDKLAVFCSCLQKNNNFRPVRHQETDWGR